MIHSDARPLETKQYDSNDLEALVNLPNYYGWIVRSFAPYLEGSVAEYGAGIGNVSGRLRAWAKTLDLIEPSPNLVVRLQARFEADDDVSVVASSMEEHIASVPDARYDAVVLVNVLEHIEDDRAAVREIFRVLKSGGHALIFVPALMALYSDLDRIVGHCRRYSRRQLVDLVISAGGDVVADRYFDFLGVLPWWLINKVGGSTVIDQRMAVLYDRISVPVTRALESIASPPVGKNVILVARKP